MSNGANQSTQLWNQQIKPRLNKTHMLLCYKHPRSFLGFCGRVSCLASLLTQADRKLHVIWIEIGNIYAKKKIHWNWRFALHDVKSNGFLKNSSHAVIRSFYDLRRQREKTHIRFKVETHLIGGEAVMWESDNNFPDSGKNKSFISN